MSNYEVEISNVGNRIVVSNNTQDKMFKYNDNLFSKAKKMVYNLDLTTMNVNDLTTKLKEIK